MGLKKLLQARLAGVTSSWGLDMAEIPLRNYGQGFMQEHRSPLASLEEEGISEQPMESCISYKCAVALQLAPRWGISPVEIAEKLVSELKNSQSINGKYLNLKNSQDFNFQFLEIQSQVIDQGIINLQVSDRSLAQWLQQLKLWPSPHQENHPKIDPEVINHLPIQSAHARCCSLLRLAAREKLIQLEDRSQHQLLDSWQILVPTEIPWLDKQGKFRLGLPQEQYLVNLLVNLVDEFDFYQDSAKNQKQSLKWLKLATEISAGLANFDRHSQIFGEVSLHNLSLAQARLGLVALTRWGLEKLLVEYLGAIAPPEL